MKLVEFTFWKSPQNDCSDKMLINPEQVAAIHEYEGANTHDIHTRILLTSGADVSVKERIDIVKRRLMLLPDIAEETRQREADAYRSHMIEESFAINK